MERSVFAAVTLFIVGFALLLASAFSVWPADVGTLNIPVVSGGAVTNVVPQADVTSPQVTSILRNDPVTSPTNADTLQWKVSFDENVKKVDGADFLVAPLPAGAALSVQKGGGGYNVTLSGGALADYDGLITLSFSVGQDITDNTGNPLVNTTPTGAADDSFLLDNTSPTVIIASTAASPNNLLFIPVSFGFSETVVDFSQSDITVSGGNLSGFSGSGNSYVVNVAPVADGPVTVDIAAAVAVDAAGNGNIAASQFQIDSDQTAPVAILTGSPEFPGTPYTLLIDFPEAVTGLELTDFTTVNAGLAGLTGSGDTYEVRVTATQFSHSVQLAANVVTDAAGNISTASDLFENAPDGGAAVITISGVPEIFLPGVVFAAGFSFSEPVVGFSAGDIGVTNASLAGFGGGSSDFTALITPDGLGNVVISIAEGAGTDASGMGSAPVSATAGLDSAQISGRLIAGFIENRARNLLQSQPGLTGFLNGRRTGSLNASVSRGRARLDLRSGGNGGAWLSFNGARSKNGSGEENQYALAVVGSHFRLGENVILGAMFQVDHAELTAPASGAKVVGTGWLAGPYIAAQLGAQPLFVEARLLYGRADNEIMPLGTFADRFESTRWLTSLAVEGAYPGLFTGAAILVGSGSVTI